MTMVLYLKELPIYRYQQEAAFPLICRVTREKRMSWQSRSFRAW